MPAKYLALLGDFAVLQKQIEAISGTGVALHLDLPAYVRITRSSMPIPSGVHSGRSSRLFQNALQQSPALRNGGGSSNMATDQNSTPLVEQLKTFSGYLWETEIVFTVTKNGT